MATRMTAKTSANRLEIIYDEGADLYNMRFFRISIHRHQSEGY